MTRGRRVGPGHGAFPGQKISSALWSGIVVVTGQRSRVVAVLAAVAVSAGCADLNRPEVERVAAMFADPATGPAARCELLVPTAVEALEHDESGPCAAVIGLVPATGTEVRSTAVWGDNAQVQFAADTMFLTNTDQGWKVVAAGCRSRGEAPYVCLLEP